MNRYENAGKTDKKNLIFGIHPIIEAFKVGKIFDKILIQENLKTEGINVIKEFIKKLSVSKLIVPKQKLNKIVPKNHQGIIGYLSPIEFQKIENVLPSLFNKKVTPLILVLDKISDVRNFGSIVRTAECAGVDCIIIPKKGAAQINSDAIKTSSGALYNIPLCKSSNIRLTGEFLRKSGLKIVAATEKGHDNYTKINYKVPIALVLGSEGKGISFDLLGLADNKVRIPIKGSIKSLNVSVAAGILIFEVLRQRNK